MNITSVAPLYLSLRMCPISRNEGTDLQQVLTSHDPETP